MPVELPAEQAHFVDREQERALAFRAVEQWRERSRPAVLALRGPGGSGKTELALWIARRLADRFSDVLCVDLDDFRLGGELDTGDVLGQLMGSLGTAPDMLAPSFKARCRQFWALTAGKRLVVVVDNARYASEVVPLMPPSGGSVVIVASHGPLYDLTDTAAELVLAPLDDDSARELLERVVADRRLAADPEAAQAMVRLCDGLPAALHVAAQWVRRHQLRPLPRLLADLRTELSEQGLPLVERVWDAAYRDLSSPAALLYRLLADHPGTTFTRWSAGALLGLGQDAGDTALEELHTAGLLDARAAFTDGSAGGGDGDGGGGDGRLRLPELLRAHARRRARQDACDGELALAQARLVRWYVRQAQRADLFAAGRRLVVAAPVGPVPGAQDVPLADPGAAVGVGPRAEAVRRAGRWLYDERHALFACVRLAHVRAWDAEAVALCEPLWTYSLDHPRQSDVVDVFRLGTAGAVRIADTAAVVRMRCQLARPLWESGRTDEAGRELDAALAALDLLGDGERDRKLGASAIEFRGTLHSVVGAWEAAAADFARSREAHAAISNAYGVMLLTYRLGQARAALGDLDGAARLLEEAHACAERSGRARMTARTGFALGHVLRRLGRGERARGLYQESLDAARGRGSDVDEARVLDALAALAQEEDHPEEARAHRAAAGAVRRRNGLEQDPPEAS